MMLNKFRCLCPSGVRGGAVGLGIALVGQYPNQLRRKVAGSIPDGVIGIFD